MSPEVINGLFALAGTIIGVAGTWLITHRFKDRKQISVIVSPLARLLDVGSAVKPDVTVHYKGRPVEALSMGEIALQNTGNSPVQEVTAVITARDESSIIDCEIASANFSYDRQAVRLEGDDRKRTLTLDFLNPNDRFVLTFTLAGKRRAPDVLVRKLGVDVVSKRDYVNWIPDIYAEVVYGIFSQMPLFKYVFPLVKPYRLYMEARKKKGVQNRIEQAP